jgi:predicted nucleic acid-binding Zn ribbon protein
MERLGAAVTEQLGRLGAPARIGPVVDVWPRLVGEAIARNAWPARIARDGTLHVTTSSSAWTFELTQLAPELLDRLRGELGSDAPPRLRFAPGRLAEPDRTPAGPDLAGPRPGSRELNAADQFASAIEDEELRSLVARAAAASLARSAAGRAV